MQHSLEIPALVVASDSELVVSQSVLGFPRMTMWNPARTSALLYFFLLLHASYVKRVEENILLSHATNRG